ncbi:DUF6318 family protein [Arthrobacter psychrolactophilus]
MITALLVTIVLAVTACNPPGDGNTTGTTPPPTIATVTPTTPATTPPPTVAAVYQPATENGPAQNVPVPVLPPKAKEFSKEGLIAFTEYWYSTLGYAFETGNPQPLQNISDPGCKTCEVMAKGVVNGFKDGKWIKGGKMVIGVPSTSFVPAADGNYQVITMARQEQVKYFRADASLSKDLGTAIAVEDILVGTFQNGAWTAITVEHLEGPKTP